MPICQGGSTTLGLASARVSFTEGAGATGIVSQLSSLVREHVDPRYVEALSCVYCTASTVSNMTYSDAPSALVVQHVSIFNNVRFGICKLTRVD